MSDENSVRKIVVIGAGYAGLAAALRSGAELILEGKPQIGGRATSIPYDPNLLINKTQGFVINTGAQWGHPDENGFNPLFAAGQELFPEQFAKLTIINDGVEHVRSATSQGVFLDGALRKRINGLLFSEWKIASQESPGQDISLGALFDRISQRENDPLIMVRARGMARNWASYENLHRLSAAKYYDDETMPGGPQIAEGTDAIAKLMVTKLQREGTHIRTNMVVKSVIQNGDGNYEITAADGFKCTAGCVIVGVPAPVLQRRLIHFSPEPTELYKYVDENIVSGFFTKIVQPMRREFFDHVGIKPNEFIDLYSMAETPLCHAYGAERPVMTFFVGGDAAPAAERRTVDQQKVFVAECFAHMDRIADFGPAFSKWADYTNGPPFTSKWCDDPMSLGSYPAVCLDKDWENAMMPMGGLIFCGDYASKVFSGTMGGAYLSGDMGGGMARDYVHGPSSGPKANLSSRSALVGSPKGP